MKKLGGRKFVLSILGALLFVCNDAFNIGLTEGTIMNVIMVIGAYIGAEGVADIVSRFKK